MINLQKIQSLCSDIDDTTLNSLYESLQEHKLLQQLHNVSEYDWRFHFAPSAKPYRQQLKQDKLKNKLWAQQKQRNFRLQKQTLKLRQERAEQSKALDLQAKKNQNIAKYYADVAGQTGASKIRKDPEKHLQNIYNKHKQQYADAVITAHTLQQQLQQHQQNEQPHNDVIDAEYTDITRNEPQPYQPKRLLQANPHHIQQARQRLLTA